MNTCLVYFATFLLVVRHSFDRFSHIFSTVLVYYLVYSLVQFSGPPAEGQGGGKPQKTLQSPDRLYKAQTDYTKPPKHYTKPRQTIQSPNRQYKAPTDNTKPQNIRQRPNILNKTLQY